MIKVIQTAKDEGIPWCEKEQLKFEEIYNFRVDTVNVNSSKTFQTHMGFGGAFTEASDSLRLHLRSGRTFFF